MVKKLILFAILFNSFISFSQSSEWTEFGAWGSGGCFPHLMTRIKTGTSNTSSNRGVLVEFKNDYSTKVTFMFAVFNNSSDAKERFREKGLLMGGTQSMISLGPGQTVTQSKSIKNLGNYNAYVEIYCLYFGDDNRHYQWCADSTPCMFCEVNGQKDPFCPNYSKPSEATNGQAQSGNVNRNQEQNQTDAYNAEYARLQGEMQRQNAETQRQNLERAKQSQQFINVYNQGVELGNTGKYTEAKAKYQEAIGLATSNEQRQQAQNAYDKVNKTAKNIETINTVSTTVQETLTGIDAIIKANKERKALENSVNKVLDTKLFDNLTKDLIIELEKNGFEYQSIDKYAEERFLKSLEKEEPTIRTRAIQFTEFTVLQTIMFIDNYGSNMEFSINTKNQQIFESLNSKKPFKIFNGDLKIYNKFKDKEKEGFFVYKIKKYEQPINSQSYNFIKQANSSKNLENKSLIPDDKILKEFVNARITKSGLKYIILNEGYGTNAMPNNTIKLHYTGMFLDGKIFDSSIPRNQPMEINGQNKVIIGFIEAIQLMNRGAKYKFYIPSNLAYGDRGAGKVIPPNTDLIFEIEIIEIK